MRIGIRSAAIVAALWCAASAEADAAAGMSAAQTLPPFGVKHTLTYQNYGDDPYSKENKLPNTDVTLYPETQNIPLDPTLSHLRPPPPRIPGTFEMFVGLSVFRDGVRCGYTVFTGFKRAKNPDRLHFGIVDQVNPGDLKCIDEYCKLAKVEWPNEECKYRSQVRVDERVANDSRGPTLARHYQQKLVGDQEFCLQLDAHSVFTNDWDVGIVKDWTTLNNEMGVLTTYLHGLNNFVGDDGTNKPPDHLPHICQTMRGGNGLVRSIGADLILQPKHPQMAALWGAGLSFSKCHAEKRVLIDNHNHWVFDGEEFLRASHLWTHGYDMYSPSKVGSVVYHNYTSVPARFEHIQFDANLRKREEEMGINRFKFVVGWPFQGLMDSYELDKYPWGTARTLHQYLDFAGITFEPGQKDKGSCKQLHWVPYSDASSVEALLPGYTMMPPPTTVTPTTTTRVVLPVATTSAHPLVLANNQHLRQHSRKPHHVSVLAVGVVVTVVLGVVVYTNDGLWRRARRLFRAKKTEAEL
ncbi:hypothetical protein H310_04246 [Aphanomyces invadans]|uniref:Glycosyltransferase 2-like domain-containing protein n=1 Tax=Aphanomyces invadans TaxID=157072 RepID=A0A024UI50_9STRA|nr:hypothetical protein H310_04246 [Aphanomyces invadans]ETW05293.1 hypothetical protein H310_04246 [Aphanomyces invadans]|eukprot:XP_008866731.1 hypothetical protein H310_04246 [Aphanomyces invadans]